MIIEFLQTRSALVVAVVGLVAYYVIPYLLDPLDYRRFQGPRLAAFTNWWMSNTIRAGCHCEVVKELHDKYGTFVRLGPNHVSIADPEALEAVYGHSSGLLKSDFYRIFQNGDPDIFNTQDNAEHTIKRKRIAHVFSPQNILALEPRISSHIQALCEQLDLRCNAALEGVSGFNWRAENGRAIVDCCLQFVYLAFDIITDLALGSSFEMVQRQQDTVPTSPGVDSPDGAPQKARELPIIKTEERGMMIITSVGVFPRWSHCFLLLLPWNIPVLIDQIKFFTVATAAVRKRLERGSKRSEGRGQADLLEKLYEAREEDPEGNSVISQQELIAEAMIMINAGWETTSHTLGALCYYLATHPEIQRRLQEELDQHAPFHNESDEYSESPTVVVGHEQVKNLPYLDACVKEALRLHSTIGTGLQRVVPPGKTFTFGGHIFQAGSVVSVPSFTINRSSLWGSNSQDFRPERWLEDESNSLTQYFSPFSLGPRGCIGRNLAMMQLLLTSGTIFRRYQFEALPTTKLRVHETFTRGAAHCEIAVRRRETVG